MQENIYDILSKHFFGQTTKEEEEIIEKYKADNSEEYGRLKQFFEHKSISVKDFDSQKAWKEVIHKYNNRTKAQPKTIRMYAGIKKALAAAAVFIGIVFGAYYYSANIAVQNSHMLQAVGLKQHKVVLSDGSVVWLNNNASLSYPDKFTGTERKIELTGEAFFQVVKNPEKPFTVITKKAAVRVLGTSFNVSSNPESTAVSVTTGTVRVQSNASNQYVTIKAGYTARAGADKVMAFKTVNRNYNSWRTGVFVFQQTPLRTIIKDLSQFYNTKIILPPSLHIDCGLTARFNNRPLKEVVEVLRLTCNLSIEETKEGYLIKGYAKSKN